MKSQIKLLGIDDGPFIFDEKHTVLIGVVMRANGYIEGVLKKKITIDGAEATDVIIDMVEHSAHKQQLKAILLDGIAVGGFNVIEINRLYEHVRIPVITITRDPPDFDHIKKALQLHFSDWKTRFDLIQRHPLQPLKTTHNPLYFACIGEKTQWAKEIITISTIRGVIPEPIRVAHLIASGITRGESVGKA